MLATFAAVGATPQIARESVRFEAPSVDAILQRYANDFGPFVMARAALEPAGRWQEFLDAFAQLVGRFATDTGAGVAIDSGYLLITVER